MTTPASEFYTGSTSLPEAGPDGNAYLACGNGQRGWFKTFAEADAVAPHVVQRAMSGRNRGSEWTVKGGP